jgi:hypothetical protein
MLQIRVHRDHDVGVVVIEARGQGGLVTEVSREAHVADPGVALVGRLQHRQALIDAPVVDEQDRPRHGEGVENACELLADAGDQSGFVEGWEDHAQAGGRLDKTSRERQWEPAQRLDRRLHPLDLPFRARIVA